MAFTGRDESFALTHYIVLKIVEKFHWSNKFVTVVSSSLFSSKGPVPQGIFDHMDSLSVLIILICEKISEAFAKIMDLDFWKWLVIVEEFSFLTPYLHF